MPKRLEMHTEVLSMPIGEVRFMEHLCAIPRACTTRQSIARFANRNKIKVKMKHTLDGKLQIKVVG